MPPHDSATPARPSDALWVERIRQTAAVVFPALIVFAALVPGIAGRVFWTIAIASLPLFFVIAGYHRWRRICPLALVSQLPARFGRAGKRRAGPWLQAHAYHVSFAVFLASLWLRLVATNGDGHAIATFLVAISTVAFVFGVLFTGKTWCNYVCPVSFVEKLYTEPRNLRPTPNSQCQKCTACRPACPDINEENSYWKEILQPAKRHVFFAFPGVVFAFYFYYYLQAGAWEYYFGGRWTNQVGLFKTAFLPGIDAITAGLFFWPAVPRAVAALATLAAGGAISFAIFALAERPVGALLRRRGLSTDPSALRHTMFTAAAFTAFVIFYTFAGAPTLRLVPGLTRAFQLLVIATATLFLVRRLTRSQSAFAEETVARQIIAKWPWTDSPPPKDLREAFLIHTIKSQSNEEARARALELYKGAIRDTVNSGVVSRAEVHRLEAIRSQMRISEADHERVMADLAEEDRDLARAILVSPEKHLQIETYTEALAVHLERGRGGLVDDEFIRTLRTEYAVTEEEHAAVLDRLVRSRERIAAHVIDAPATIETTAIAVEVLEALNSPAAAFIVRLLRRRVERAADTLLQTIGGPAAGQPQIREGLLSRQPADRTAALAALGSRVPATTSARLTESQQRARAALGQADAGACLRAQFGSPDPYVRAAALYTLESLDLVTDADYEALAKDEHPIVQESLEAARRVATGRTIMAEPTTLSKMIGLKSIAIFEGLEPEDLAQLARAGRESWFMSGETLCREGEMGNEVFVLMTGEVSIQRRIGGTDKVVATEGPGSVIGELAVLDPAPRDATVVVSTVAARALRLSGPSFRSALTASPVVSDVIIRMLARRLRTHEKMGS